MGAALTRKRQSRPNENTESLFVKGELETEEQQLPEQFAENGVGSESMDLETEEQLPEQVESSTQTAKPSLLTKTWNTAISIPSAIWGAIKAVTHWVWANGIQMTSSYPNGKKDAQNLTAGKIFKQLAGFVTSMVATTAVRLIRLGIYVAAASVLFFTIFSIVSTAPISVPVAAVIAGLTALTSAAVVATVVGLATKSMMEEPSKAIDRNFYKFINLLVGNVDDQGKLNKYSSGEELDALSKKSHQFGYNAADFILNLPRNVIGMVFGKSTDQGPQAVTPEDSVEMLVLTAKNTDSAELGAKNNVIEFGSRKRANSQMTLRQAAELGPEVFRDAVAEMVRIASNQAAASKPKATI